MSRIITVFGGYANSETTGGLRMAWRTAAALVERGHEVAVLTDSARPPGSSADLPVQFRTREHLGGDTDWRRPDVVHVYDLASEEYARLGYDLACEAGAEFLLTPASAPGTWPDHQLGRRLCGAAGAVFTLSPSEAAHLADLRRVRLAHPPHPAGTGSNRGRRRRGVPEPARGDRAAGAVFGAPSSIQRLSAPARSGSAGLAGFAGDGIRVRWSARREG